MMDINFAMGMSRTTGALLSPDDHLKQSIYDVLMLHRHIGGLENRAMFIATSRVLHRHIGGLENLLIFPLNIP